MKELYLVGFTPDHDGLVLSARKGSTGGGYKIVIDAELVDHVDELRAQRGVAPTRPRSRATEDRPGRSSLTPREIQERLRAGCSVAEVAAEAGADPSWIDRFAGPVLAEQTKAVELAIQLPLTTAPGRTEPLPLAEAVAANLAGPGGSQTEPRDTEGWSAYRIQGPRWRVRYTFRQRGRQAQAEWSADLAEGTITPANDLGGELGSVGSEPGRAQPADVDQEAPQEQEAEAEKRAKAAERAAAKKEAAQAKAAAKRQADQERAEARQAAAEESDRQRKADLAAKAAAKKEAAAAKAAAKAAARKEAAAKRAAAKERAAQAASEETAEQAVAADGQEESRGVPSPDGDQLAFEDLPSTPDAPQEMAPLRNGGRPSGQDP